MRILSLGLRFGPLSTRNAQPKGGPGVVFSTSETVNTVRPTPDNLAVRGCNVRNSVLTPRQRECLSLARYGNTSADAAKNLNLSVRTVERYIANACERLNVRTRTQAVAEAMARGLI